MSFSITQSLNEEVAPRSWLHTCFCFCEKCHIKMRLLFLVGCSFVQQLECSKHTRTRNARATSKAKKQNQRPELRQHTKDPLWLSWCF